MQIQEDQEYLGYKFIWDDSRNVYSIQRKFRFLFWERWYEVEIVHSSHEQKAIDRIEWLTN